MKLKKNEAMMYLILKYIEQEEEPEFRIIDVEKKDFHVLRTDLRGRIGNKYYFQSRQLTKADFESSVE
ncbi:hypothetical protein H1230_10650 [Paenibacillus sp. 19GGS1-52]|uniref:hypothetical protein n=1 Tax=Paenibacillus sp. 19GGS1-52 TaxID=2758563 RepID=UPI001EFB884B|nr:hypothetical protein [Paenibacillus sp. 19GGS1-52]ULO09185.1 hypothetical protein H1230_10650 [Paenibacillus sp. 19GGS1-52]